MRLPLKMIFFDAVGTLIFLPQSVGEHYREIALRHGADLPAENLDRAFRACWKSAPARENSAVGPRPDDDKGWWRLLVQRVLQTTLPGELKQQFDHTAFFDELYAHFAMPGVWAVYPEVNEILVTLRARGLKLGVISNFDRRLYQVFAHLELSPSFTSLTISSEVGAEKPCSKIFEQALSANGLRAEEAVHVGDDPKCDRGAQAVGLDVYELNRRDSTLHDFIVWLDRRVHQQNQLASTQELP